MVRVGRLTGLSAMQQQIKERWNSVLQQGGTYIYTLRSSLYSHETSLSKYDVNPLALEHDTLRIKVAKLTKSGRASSGNKDCIHSFKPVFLRTHVHNGIHFV